MTIKFASRLVDELKYYLGLIVVYRKNGLWRSLGISSLSLGFRGRLREVSNGLDAGLDATARLSSAKRSAALKNDASH